MNLFLDNIIFSLQKAGGISVLWYELLHQILNDTELNPLFLEIPNENIFSVNIKINNNQLLHNSYAKYPVIIQRFLNPKDIKGKGIFHSSYYRTVYNPNIINITTVHDFSYEYYRNGIPKIIHHFQKEVAIKNSKRIICVSHNTKKDLLKFYPEINPTRIKVIYNGVNDIYKPIFNKDEDELKKLINFSSGEFVLYIGTSIEKNKNFNLAVQACKLSKLPLVIIGVDPLSKDEHFFITNALGKDHYKFLQGINNQQLNIIYNHALCLLYPSIYEGFGIPIVEAQRVGCPVISTNFSAIPEVAGKGAILLNEVTENKIAEILSILKRDSAFVESYIKDGFENSKRFSWEQCFQETKQLYKDVYEEYFSNQIS